MALIFNPNNCDFCAPMLRLCCARLCWYLHCKKLYALLTIVSVKRYIERQAGQHQFADTGLKEIFEEGNSDARIFTPKNHI
jgi:hypothetical protein